MNRKQTIILMILALTLMLFFNVLRYVSVQISPKTLSTEDLINKEQITSQKLFDKAWKTVKKGYYDSSLNGQNWNRWKDHYRNKIKTDEDAKVAINTMIASLNDPYSKYLSKTEFADQNSSIDSKITGIGVTIFSNSGKIMILNVIEGTPAYSAGLKTGDIIFTVENKEVSGMSVSDVAGFVRGPENSVVNITLLRDNKKINKKIKRKEIKIKTVKSSVEDNIGYIQILSFIGISTSNEFLEALENTNDTEGLILDLRGNPGGLLPNAIFIANLFINEGNIVSIVGRNGYKHNITAQESNYNITKPLIVLIDGTSASASEILSGALKDYKKAKLIGTKTYGKGMVQQIMPLPNETGINLTIAKYLTPLGTDINKKGISPDVVIELTENDVKNAHDVQLEKAKSVMREMLVKN